MNMIGRPGRLLPVLALAAVFTFALAFVACDDDDDAVGEELEPTMNVAEEDLDDYWRESMDDLDKNYDRPRQVSYYTEVEETPCGETIPNNAFYCPPDNSIYLDQAFLQAEFDNIGPFAPVFILAHEWGHLIQGGVGILEGISFTIQVELQADCLAGAYTRDLDDRDLITDENLLEAGVTLIQVGDPLLYPWYAPGAHGSAEQRVAAYTDGYNTGIETCLAPPYAQPLED